jgi:hypothetical protein
MMSQATGPSGKNPLVGDEEYSLLVHDIRDSLYALRMGLELLKAKCQEKQLSEFCDSLAEEERNATRLLEELLVTVRERFERLSG